MHCRLLLLLGCLFLSVPAWAADARVKKVLPFYLDAQGRNSLSPSLYERDAYQTRLKQNPELRKALRVDVLWNGRAASANRTIKVELRANRAGVPTETTHVRPAGKPRWLGRWQSVEIAGEDFEKLGELLAWRVTLWDGEQQVAEKKSFLW